MKKFENSSTRRAMQTAWRLAAVVVLATGAARAADVQTFAVNDYFDMKYVSEPVSFDVSFEAPVPAAQIGLKQAGEPAVCQVEVLEGTPAAVKRARVWTLVSTDAPVQKLYTVTTGAAAPPPASPFTVSTPDAAGLATVGNGTVWVKVPVDGSMYAAGTSAFALPGPVASVSRDGKTWIGQGYLDSMSRLAKLTCTVEQGPVYFQSLVRYDFDNGRTYTSRVRLYAGKPYAALVEDFNLGGASRYIFNFGTWPIDQFFRTGDQRLADWRPTTQPNPAEDFIVEEGQKCLARMVVWTQFNYFGGKQETIAVRTPDSDTTVGAFYLRPDRWTRAKVNHVDLYVRPEVAGDRMTRGVVGLAGAEERIAMEAWLVDGHREWAIFAVSAGQMGTRQETVRGPDGKPVRGADGKEQKREVPEFKNNPFLSKAHVTEGVWPLDRIIRLPLVWNASGQPVAPADTAPKGEMPYGGDIGNVLKGTGGRAGLQHFNGSNSSMRGGYVGQAKKVLEWAKANAADLEAAKLQAGKGVHQMVGPAMAAYMAMDESTYPGRRAMLAWTDPEALNPFYQGMENMNFNADRYNSVSAVGAALVAMKHPEGQKILLHGQEQMDMALDRYVYPESGTWEESHTYAQHTLKNLIPLARNLRDMGARNFFDDPRFARLFEWWTYTCTPRDPGFGGIRLQPPIGDHGLSLDTPVEVFKNALPDLAASSNPEVQRVVRQMAWLIKEHNEEPPAGVTPQAPDLRSRYVQGHGVIMRATDPKGRESFITLRAEQSWGHHHQDKGSLWGWFRNVHFFGDAAWGGPPGETYGNSYKQGPASGTQIEFRGINNWTLPCKYPAPWISDDAYTDVYDYANARCRYPYNPRLNLGQSTPVALRNGYDRQVLFVRPDLMIVRDNVEATVPTVWRFHSYQAEGTTVDGARATLASPQKVIGELDVLYPPGLKLSSTTTKDELDGDTRGVGQAFGRAAGEADAKGQKAPFDTRTVALRTDLPLNTSVTWTFSVHDAGEPASKPELLDKDGRVTRLKLPDGREVTALLNSEPFTFSGDGIEFEGTVGLVIRSGGKTAVYPIRASKLTAK